MIRLLYRAIFFNFNFMTWEKWLSLPEGTKVRMTCYYGPFRKWDIVTRVHCWSDNDRSVRFETEDSYWYFKDHQWEIIEELKEDWLIQDTNGNLTKSDSFQMPKQGDKIQVKNEWWTDWSWTIKTFVCFYNGKVISEDPDSGLQLWGQWRFPPQEEVTLSDGKTYLVEERGGEKILKLKK